MTEAEWLASTSPVRLMDTRARPARKVRLAFCACLRDPAVWPLLVSKSSRRAVDLAERFADHLTHAKALRTVRASAHSAWARIGPMQRREYVAAELAYHVCRLDRMLLQESAGCLSHAISYGLTVPTAPIRDVFGNPFRPVAFSPELRTDTAVSLARGMYESRDFGAMPILADALQDAGCDNEDILNHCRQPGEHVRGCWVADLVLGKE